MLEVIDDASYRAAQTAEVAKYLKDAQINKRVILTTGLAVVDCAITAKNDGDVLVSILDPGRNYEKFDLIYVPKHDPHPKLSNIRTTTGIINRVNTGILKDQAISGNFRKPVIAVLIGGRHVGGNFSADDAERLANIINKADCTALVTTSKRTEAKATKVLKQNLWRTEMFYDYNQDGQAGNPYLQMLAGADKIIVTADSARMCSEAASSSKQVFIFSPEKLHFSYAALRDSFFKAKAALDIGMLNSNNPTVTLNEAKRVADEIIEYIKAL